MRFIKIALFAFVVAGNAAVCAGESNMWALPITESAVASVIAQRTFAGVLPSIADYSQTAHSVLKDGEYCPVDSLTGASYCQPGSKWVMWDTPFMQFDTKKKQGREMDDGTSSPKYGGWDMDMSGFGTGIGRMLNDTTVIGLAVGWDARKLDMDSYTLYYPPGHDPDNPDEPSWTHVSGKDRSDAFHAALYGGTAIGCFFVDAYAGFSRTWHRGRFDTHSEDYDAGVLDDMDITKVTAKYSDTVYSAGVKASYVWILPNEMRITSTLGLDYAHIRRGNIKVDGVNVEHQFNPDNIIIKGGRVLGRKASLNSLQTPISIAVNKTFQSDFLSFKGRPSWWTPEFRAGYTPQFGNRRFATKVSEDGDEFQKFKSSELASYGTVGAGVKIKLADKYIFAVDYDYRFGRDYKSHLVTGTYGVSF